MTPRPCRNLVWLEIATPKEERRGLIWVPEKARSKPQEGRITAVGPDVTTVKVGELVLFGRYSVQEMEGYGHVIREGDIIAVIE